jgi:hypothetical protein
VNFMTFGLSKADDRGPLYKLIVNTGKMDSYTTTLALRECYETQYGIFNHDDPLQVKLNPMALVAMHPKEDTYAYSMEHRFMWRFRQYEICKTWGYDLSAFLELPWYQCQAIFRIEQRRAAEQLRKDEEAKRKDDRTFNATSPQAPNNPFTYQPQGGRKR